MSRLPPSAAGIPERGSRVEAWTRGCIERGRVDAWTRGRVGAWTRGAEPAVSVYSGHL
jgi:hypothetical protein